MQNTNEIKKPPVKGIYILVLYLRLNKKLTIGSLGDVFLKKGYYLYVGSAVGSGGISGRLKHHISKTSNPHWHIDYLKNESSIVDIYFSEGSKELEHFAADKLSLKFISPINKFGSSDCKCYSHLFYSPHKPLFDELIWGDVILKLFNEIKASDF
jgi:Uri superfamily endonuclease